MVSVTTTAHIACATMTWLKAQFPQRIMLHRTHFRCPARPFDLSLSRHFPMRFFVKENYFELQLLILKNWRMSFAKSLHPSMSIFFRKPKEILLVLLTSVQSPVVDLSKGKKLAFKLHIMFFVMILIFTFVKL